MAAPLPWLRWAPVAILVAAVIAVYSNALNGPFFLDDIASIVENPAIRRLWPLTAALNPPPVDVTYCTRPFINLTMCVNYALGGLGVRGYRLTNVLLHLGAAWALFGLLRLALRSAGRDENDSRLLALAAALIWAVHPLATSAVNYLSQRSEVAVGFFFFLMLYALHRAVAERPSEAAAPAAGHAARFWLTISFLACLLGMGSKESMAVAPFLAITYDRIFLAPSWKHVLARRGLFYLLLAATLLWPVSRQLAYSPHVMSDVTTAPVFSRYLLTQAWGLARMLHLAVWPHPLNIDYGTRLFTQLGQVWVLALLAFLLAGMTLVSVKRFPRAGFLGLCFFAFLAPASLLPIVGQPIAEHRFYIPLAALAAGAASAIFGGLARRPGGRRRFVVLLALWALALGLRSHARNRTFQDAVRLWQDAVERQPDNGRAWNNLGLVLSVAGRHEEALTACGKAVRWNPSDAQAHSNLANALCALGRYEEALRHYREALRLNPEFGPGYSNYASALNHLRRYEEALVHCRIALRFNPGLAEAHLNIATALAQSGRPEEALDHLRAAVRLQPANYQAHNNLGNCLLELDRKEEALEHYREAVRQRPAYLPALANLGFTLIDLGRSDEAIAAFVDHARRSNQPAAALNEFAALLAAKGCGVEGLVLAERVLELQPDHPLALNTAAWILATSTNDALRDGPRAMEFAERAVARLGHNPPTALATLAAAQAEAGRFAEAVETAQRALAGARQGGDTALVARFEARIEAYRDRRPWRE